MAETERFSRLRRSLAALVLCGHSHKCSLQILTATLKTLPCLVHRTRSAFSLPPVRRSSSNRTIPRERKKDTLLSIFFLWRRQRDLNSRAGNSRPTPLAGAPLRPTWVCLRINGGENRIRTYGTFRYHWFSRPAP